MNVIVEMMVKIDCPVCGEGLELNENEMSSLIKVHLEQAHGLYGPDVTGRRGGMEHPPSSDAMAGGRMADSTATYSEMFGDELTLRGEDLYGTDRPPDPRVMERRSDMLVLFCPLCGYELLGKNGEELSTNLREHMAANNELVECPPSPR